MKRAAPEEQLILLVFIGVSLPAKVMPSAVVLHALLLNDLTFQAAASLSNQYNFSATQAEN